MATQCRKRYRSRVVTQKTIPPPIQHHEGVSHVYVDEKRLRTAIQVLDGNNDTVDGNVDKLRSVLASLAYFLELVVLLDHQGTESIAARNEISTAIEARVLSCIKRLLERQKPVSNPLRDNEPFWNVWHDWTCPKSTKTPNNCATQLIHNALTCFLYLLARDVNMAPLVERSGLHRYLIELCRGLWRNTETEPLQVSTYIYDHTNDDIDAKDITLGIDAFDWCTRTIYSTFANDITRMAVFMLPIGPRTFSHLLLGHKLPNNEGDEFDLHKRFSWIDSTSMSKGRRRKHPLPSIFEFGAAVNKPKTKRSNKQKCPICDSTDDRLTKTAWEAARTVLTMQRFSIRAMVALALHLKKSSLERKIFIRDGAIHRLWVAHQVLKATITRSNRSSNPNDQDDHRADTVYTLTNATEEDGMTMNKESSQESRLLHAMIVAGLRAFTSNEIAESLNSPSSPSNDHNAPTTHDNPSEDACDTEQITALEQKLRTVTDQSRRKGAHEQQQLIANEFAMERKMLRHSVRDRLLQAETLRAHLIQGLVILGTGRVHPSAQQSMVDWLSSFPTIEKKEQERREQEEMRLQRIMEMQYQIEERRRRERDERTLMAHNDVHVPDVTQKALQDAKRLEFKRLQEEMKLLEENRVEHQDEEIQQRKRQAEIEETKRWQKQVAERKRETQENEKMAKQDTYYVEKIWREKRAAEEKAKKAKRERVDPLEEQKQHIEKMRLLDTEKKRCEQEVDHMRTEDLFGRRQQFLDTEKRKKETEREWKARKEMERIEKDLRQRWKAIDAEIANKAVLEQKQQRAEERRERREKEKLERQEQNAWITCYDEYGNAYYYNQLTGVSQWTSPIH